MKGIHFLLIPALGLLAGCSTPKSVPSSRPPVDETSCRTAVREALVYKSKPATTLSYFQTMQSERNTDGKHMDQYYSTLGVNLSSIALVLTEELDEKISLNLRDATRPEMAEWLNKRIPNGKSLVDLEDVDGTFFDDEFLRVDLKKKSMVTGYFYVHCGVIEDRDIAEKVYVDYFKDGSTEPRKLSLAALLRLM